MQHSGNIIDSARTIPAMFAARVERDADRPALITKFAGEFRTETWRQVADEVRRYAVGLYRNGVRPGDRVAQYCENRREWILLDLAIQLVQAVHVPLHAPLTGVQVAEQVTDSGARVLFVSNRALAEKLRSVQDRLPQAVQVFAHEPVPVRIRSQDVATWNDVAVAAPIVAEQIQTDCLARLTENSLATILYTSGTTGEPKGVVLSQQNVVSNSIATVKAMGMNHDDLRLVFLPLSHIFARTCDLYSWICVGSQLALATSRESVVDDSQTLQPTIVNGVPYFFQLLKRTLEQQGHVDQPSALRDLLGGRIRMCCSGGAALPDHLFDYFQSQHVPLLQGYGLTESSPVITVSSLTSVRRSAVGRPISDVEVRIADDGEIVTRGPHVMVGYWNKPQATDEVVRDGWLHTGDIGRVDDDGFLYITGRKKELIVTAAGKNIAPVLIESLLTEDPLIAQALVIGDDRNYLTALIVLDTNGVQERLREMRWAEDATATRDSTDDVPTETSTTAAHLVHEWIHESVQQRLANLSHHEQVRKFAIVERPFTIATGEMTPKLSLRRKVIEHNYAAQIAQMYAAR